MITDVICLEGNGTRPSHRGSGYSEGAMYILNITEVHCVAYRIGAFNSEGMKSENPHAGVYKTDTAPTLDSINCGYPCGTGLQTAAGRDIDKRWQNRY